MRVSDIEIGMLIQKVDSLTTSVETLSGRIEKLEGVANRGKGFLFGIFLFAGSVGAAISAGIQNVFNK